MENEPSLDRPVEPILEDVMPSSSTDKGKRKVSEESLNLEKEAKNPFVKVTKRKRSVPATTIPTATTPVMPKPKRTRKIVEATEVLVSRSPQM